MRKTTKVLSAILIAASLFGLVGGGLALKDALGSKAYWEAASGGGDSIGMLEDGLNQLKANEQAYLDGRKALEEGKAAYAEGKAQLEEGAKALEEGQKAYDEGVKTLEQKTAEYEAGVQKLAAAGVQLAEGKIPDALDHQPQIAAPGGGKSFKNGKALRYRYTDAIDL